MINNHTITTPDGCIYEVCQSHYDDDRLKDFAFEHLTMPHARFLSEHFYNLALMNIVMLGLDDRRLNEVLTNLWDAKNWAVNGMVQRELQRGEK